MIAGAQTGYLQLGQRCLPSEDSAYAARPCSSAVISAIRATPAEYAQRLPCRECEQFHLGHR